MPWTDNAAYKKFLNLHVAKRYHSTMPAVPTLCRTPRLPAAQLTWMPETAPCLSGHGLGLAPVQ